MRIVAVCTAYHETDIIDMTVKHLLAEGIDDVYVECPTGDEETATAAAEAGAHVRLEYEQYHDQPMTINHLAWEAEADWILPFDADEFFYSPLRNQTIRETLADLPDTVSTINVPKYQQHDWWWGEPYPTGASKVVYRWSPEMKIGPGNHTVTGADPNSLILNNGLLLRELQYRSFEHFKRKVEERSRTIDPSFGPEMGWHIRQHAGKSEAALQQAYLELTDPTKTIWAPIPTKVGLPDYTEATYAMYDLMKMMAHTPCDIAGHLQRLHDLVGETGAKHVIECGVNTGMSTIAFLASGAVVYSCDYADVRQVVRPEVNAAQNWHLAICDDREWAVPDHRPAKVVFIDTSHTYQHSLDELAKYWPMVAPGGAMAWHDSTTCPEQIRAHKHWRHTVDDIARTEAYEHDNGLVIYWKDGLSFLTEAQIKRGGR